MTFDEFCTTFVRLVQVLYNLYIACTKVVQHLYNGCTHLYRGRTHLYSGCTMSDRSCGQYNATKKTTIRKSATRELWSNRNCNHLSIQIIRNADERLSKFVGAATVVQLVQMSYKLVQSKILSWLRRRHGCWDKSLLSTTTPQNPAVF